MDVRFINPFLDGAAEVLGKMAGVKPVVGKPFAKFKDSAYGDVSGIIGMTGDAIGSLALTFSEECIIGIVSRMVGENYSEINKDVTDAVGELTNMISGASRKIMERDNLKVFAAIPSVIHGKDHSVRHVIQGTSIVIPFKTESGDFVIDVCLQSQLDKKEEKMGGSEQETQQMSESNSQNVNMLNYNIPSLPQQDKPVIKDRISIDLGKTPVFEYKDVGEKIEHLKKILAEINAGRDAIMKELKNQPFMEKNKRLRYKSALPAYEAKIKRLKLDIVAAETVSKMTQEEFENPKLKTDYQHYEKKK